MMNKNVFPVKILLPLAALIWAGCAGLGSSGPVAPAEPEVLIARIAHYNQRVETFSGRAVMTVAAEDERPFRATLQIAIKRPDSLWFKLEGPLGIDMAQGNFGGGVGQVFIPIYNRLYRGTVERLQTLDMLPLDLPVSEMFMSFVGLPVPVMPAADSLLSVTVQGHGYHLDYGYGESIDVDAKGPVVTRWEKRDAYGDPQWLWEGESFYKISGIRLPKIVRMSQYLPRQRLLLVYDSMKPNTTLKPSWSRIPIPEGVEVIEL